MLKEQVKIWLERLKEKRKWKSMNKESLILLNEKIWILEKVLE